ncbi:Oidioi.mRNA.OKI2018_I69.chr1.g446.t1.cds [Oikopleura dioica]|uniref:Oidioi.mRNA.OKI2018_I69.chr1.g446.t1.cds n=1 Tax=Oikopleura dioica TaxID=34765 RepID=A0ABN7SNK2_OIKDI|nr:Oidioi.mRNA.OKI2018_I69.chr1.g446.t1.cds [Oikopleura dioica]
MPSHLKLSWNKAKKICEKLGGELAYFDTEEEYSLYKESLNILAQENLGKYRFEWLGIERKNDKFINLDGQQISASFTPENFNIWAPEEPNNQRGRENCVGIDGLHIYNIPNPGPFMDSEIHLTNRWVDRKCNEKRQFTCKFKNALYC